MPIRPKVARQPSPWQAYYEQLATQQGWSLDPTSPDAAQKDYWNWVREYGQSGTPESMQGLLRRRMIQKGHLTGARPGYSEPRRERTAYEPSISYPAYGGGTYGRQEGSSGITGKLRGLYESALLGQINEGFDLSGAGDVMRGAENRQMQQLLGRTGMGGRSAAATMRAQQLSSQSTASLARMKQEEKMKRLNLLRQAYAEQRGYQT